MWFSTQSISKINITEWQRSSINTILVYVLLYVIMPSSTGVLNYSYLHLLLTCLSFSSSSVSIFPAFCLIFSILISYSALSSAPPPLSPPLPLHLATTLPTRILLCRRVCTLSSLLRPSSPSLTHCSFVCGAAEFAQGRHQSQNNNVVQKNG